MKRIASALARWCALLSLCCLLLESATTYTIVTTITTSGTAVTLSSSQISATSYVITARSDNAGTVYFGGSNVNASTKVGTPLPAGQSSGWLPISGNASNQYDLNKIWADSTSSGDHVVITYVH